VEVCQRSEIADVTAKVVTYEAFVGGKPEAPKHLDGCTAIGGFYPIDNRKTLQGTILAFEVT
jgi:hypothetical protein